MEGLVDANLELWPTKVWYNWTMNKISSYSCMWTQKGCSAVKFAESWKLFTNQDEQQIYMHPISQLQWSFRLGYHQYTDDTQLYPLLVCQLATTPQNLRFGGCGGMA